MTKLDTITIKQEIVNNLKPKDCCDNAILSSIVHTCGVLKLRSGELQLVLKLRHLTSVIWVLKQFAKWGLSCNGTIIDIYIDEHEFLTINNIHAVDNKKMFSINIVGDRLIDLLSSLGILQSKNKRYLLTSGIDSFLVLDYCCKLAYIKGAFLGCGVVSFNKNKYVEYTLNSPQIAIDLQVLLQGLDIKSSINVVEFNNTKKIKLHIYGQNTIADFFTHLKATNCSLKVHDMIFKNAVLSITQRVGNCYAANNDKTALFSVEMVEYCNNVLNSSIFSMLSHELQNTIKMRIDYYQDTLSQLASRLLVSKSCVKHRLDKIKQLATTTN